MNCDICNLPAEPAQGLYGARGTGNKTGPRMGSLRHYQCHIDTYGKPIAYSTERQHSEMKPRPAGAVYPTRPLIRTPKVTKGEYNRSPNAMREYRVLDRITEMGRSRVEIECPFCFERFWAFIWSISGGGKKCTNCGAKHASFGQAFPIVGNEDM
jgi:hypothetical protein